MVNTYTKFWLSRVFVSSFNELLDGEEWREGGFINVAVNESKKMWWQLTESWAKKYLF